MRTLRKISLLTLWSTLIVLVILELYLRTDPWGVLAYLDNLGRLTSVTDSDPDLGYILKPGTYPMNGWQISVDQERHRVVPGTDLNASCEIALLGDSVTMSWGVNDNQTWASLVAQQLPGVHLINTGVFGYNARDIELSYERNQGKNAYLYLMIDNDNWSGTWGRDDPMPFALALQAHIYLLGIVGYNAPTDNQMFADNLQALRKVPNLVITSFDTNPLVQAVDTPVISIPMYTHMISKMDSHADPQGNREIAAHMLPILREMAERYCSAQIAAQSGDIF